MLVRLHKFMAACGVASRRKCEEMIEQGKVAVNGRRVTELGAKIDPTIDEVTVSRRRITQPRRVVLIMNKPKGIVTTMNDERGRRQVTEFLPELDVTVKPVGRLDKDSEGLLVFTNDGDLAALLTHPKHLVSKTYRVVVEGLVDDEKIDKLRAGIWVPLDRGSHKGRKTRPAIIDAVGRDPKAKKTSIEITIQEGRKRQIRAMFEAIGHSVTELKRTRFGSISLGKLPPGACKMLSKSEVDRLESSATPAPAIRAAR
ncbi:MAG: rRNA pseudouridine synthase [Armatimonadota bacterium]|nr:rRNA pseudouridine synthase [Armatimonadota bacterium]